MASKLTEKKAIQISKELWAWLAETGADHKYAWAGWEKYGEMENECPLCQYEQQFKVHSYGHCPTCPYFKIYGCCYGNGDKLTFYEEWEQAETESARKKYAKLFFEQLEQL